MFMLFVVVFTAVFTALTGFAIVALATMESKWFARVYRTITNRFLEEYLKDI